jgi:hypothetical protein
LLVGVPKGFTGRVTVADLSGRTVLSARARSGEVLSLPAARLAQGTFLVSAAGEGNRVLTCRIVNR